MTNNFYTKNVRFTYAIENPSDDNEDDFYWEYIENNIKEQLKKIGFIEADSDTWVKGTTDTKVLAEKIYWDSTGAIAYHLQATIRSGYYTGANLDYELTFEDCDGYKSDTLDSNDIEETLDYDEPDKRHTRDAKRIEKEIRKHLNKDIDAMERIFWTNSTPLTHQGTFSNGEAVYRPAKRFYELKQTN